jgi:type I restriction enzyme, S subunit
LMSSSSERSTAEQTRTYDRASSVVFLRTRESFGGLSNMAGGFPLLVQGTRIYSSEALYQACRFPHLPKVQRLIIEQTSPMTAKMKSKPHRKNSRPDWDRVRVKVMRWCLRVKLAQNWAKFSTLLLSTDQRPIVEESRKDDFWGAKPADDHTLVGMNVLGRLLMELREAVKQKGEDGFRTVEPPDIADFLLLGQPIRTIRRQNSQAQDADSAAESPTENRSLFDSSVREAPSRQYIERSAIPRTYLDLLKPYPAMKESRVPWLGNVPAHWKVLPNRAFLTEVKERGHPEADMLSVTITRGVIRQQALLEDSSKKDSSNLDKAAYKLVRPGDIAYNKMRAWQGAVGVSEYRGIVSPAYIVQRPREDIVPRYLHFLLRTPSFAKEAERWSYGITSDMWSLRPEHFRMIYSCLPPFSEQAAIVRFLDHADRRIRRYMHGKQKLIELLEEQEQAIINRAVTRGLDPNVRLMPSGVEWLGDVPEHWEVKRLHQITDPDRPIMYGIVLPGPNVDNGVYIVKGGNCERGRLRPELLSRTTFEIESRYARSRLRGGDIVFAIRGGVGAAEVVPAELTGANLTQDAARIAAGHGIDPRWLLYTVRAPAFREQVKSQVLGATVRGINIRDLKRIELVVPPLAEQAPLVFYLNRATRGIVSAIDRALREITLLREYRNCLITDVTTGKLDVRDASAQLADEVGESARLEGLGVEIGDGSAADDSDEVPEEARA